MTTLMVLAYGPQGPMLVLKTVEQPLSVGDTGKQLAAIVDALVKEYDIEGFTGTSDPKAIARIHMELGLPLPTGVWPPPSTAVH